jgi:hypothetical protein
MNDKVVWCSGENAGGRAKKFPGYLKFSAMKQMVINFRMNIGK